MENVKMAVEGDELVLRVNLKHRGKFTGKTTRVASTEGNVQIPGYADTELKVGLNIFTKDPAKSA